MQLSKPELLLLEQIANGNKAVKTIAKALNKSDKQIYVTARKLAEKGLIERLNGILETKRITYVALLVQMLAKIPNLVPVLADSGIPILIAMLGPVTIQEIRAETGFKRTAIHDKIREGKRRSMIKKRASTYELNDKIWHPLREFLEEFMLHETATDKRVPAGAIIYHKNDHEIVFSSREELDAAKTAFSAYGKYGITILTATDYYYFPKKKLTKRDVLIHSLHVFEKEKDMRSLTFIALFYAKFKREFKMKHSVLTNLKAVLGGEKIEGYPKYQEIKDRAEVYGIKV